MIPLEYGSDIGGSIRVPAHFCGVFGHKPTFGLVPPSRPRAAAVRGPERRRRIRRRRPAGAHRQRSGAGAGRSGRAATATWRAPTASTCRRRAAPRFADFRVLVLDAHPLAGVDTEVLRAAARSGRAAGGRRRRGLPRQLADPRSRRRAGDLHADAGHDHVPRPSGRRAGGGHLRLHGRPRRASPGPRRSGRTLFETFDVVIAPPFGTAAFPHTDEADWPKRRLTINGEATPYGAQIAWSGIATFPGLPSTCAPIGKTKAGLPVGVQIIGPTLRGPHHHRLRRPDRARVRRVALDGGEQVLEVAAVEAVLGVLVEAFEAGLEPLDRVLGALRVRIVGREQEQLRSRLRG